MGIGSGQKLINFIKPGQLLWKVSDAARQFRQRQTLSPERALGHRGEDLAHRYLQRAGFRIMARNYRASEGEAEVDIVAREGPILVFVEVKTRSSSDYGSPDRAIGLEKQKNIAIAARAYAQRAGADWDQVRFDTVSIVFGHPPSIVHQRDAFFGGRWVS